MLTVQIVLAVTAFIAAILAIAKKVPVEAAVILLALIALLQALPKD